MKLLSIFRKYPILTLFILALFMRTYKLGSTPVGFHVDEARVGWNAYSILKTGKDDFGQVLSLYYNSFGDYRPSGIFYLTVPFIKIFGLTQFAIRAPSALFGALTVIPLYLITISFLENYKKKYAKRVGIVACLFFAILPWGLSVSRATSEAVISSFFLNCGLLFLLKTHKKPINKNYFLSFFFFLMGYLFYHSGRLLVPLFSTIFIFYTPKYALKKAIVFAVITIILTASFIAIPGTLGRFKQVSISKDQTIQQSLGSHKRPEWEILYGAFRDQYATYLSSDFLVGNTAKPLRYRLVGMGLVSIGLFALAIVGIVASFKEKGNHLPIWLLFISPIPAAITAEDSPNLHRTVFMSLLICYFGALGFMSLWETNLKARIISIILVSLSIVSSYNYFYNYIGPARLDPAEFRNFGMDDLISFISQRESTFDSIVLAGDPDSPYPWYAFYNKLDPKTFNAAAATRNSSVWKYKNITFTTDRCPSGDALTTSEKEKINTVVVDAGVCDMESIKKAHPSAKVEKEIHFPDTTVAYRVWSELNH